MSLFSAEEEKWILLYLVGLSFKNIWIEEREWVRTGECDVLL
jgi:hypothetical protein